MEAFFDQRKHPKVVLRVKGRKQVAQFEAILDTGFDGYLSLPINIAVSLGLELITVTQVEYADGRTSQELVFSIDINLDGIWRSVPLTLTGGSEALAGTALLENYSINFNFPNQKISINKHK
ncbi:hypothetical protein HYT02_00230 [Candidatus Gottesmanbacteria bacterium]|nr:hypothetical protein [Candidatus Gottesmanbacteria bacterium]